MKLLIADAYIVKQLQSDDIKMLILDQHTKDCVLNQLQINNF